MSPSALALLLTIAVALQLTHVNAAEHCIEGRYSDSLIFDLDQIAFDRNIVYGRALDWKGRSVALKLNLAYPRQAVDEVTRRPLLVLLHGGSFLGGKKDHFSSVLIDLARRGFAAAAVGYRLGWNTNGDIFDCEGDMADFRRSLYRTVQDCRAALRFLAAAAENYGIDPEAIFLYGYSAGAICALHTAFVDQEEFKHFDPELQRELGMLDKAGNNLSDSYRIRAVVSVAGALLHDVDAVDAAIPVLAMHGTADSIIPYDSGAFLRCYEPVAYEFALGAAALTRRIRSQGGCAELHTKIDGTHAAYDIRYRFDNTACFVKRVLCGTCSSADFHQLDPDCRSLRVTDIDEETEGGGELFVVAPHPVRDILRLTGVNSGWHNARLTLSDSFGRIVLLAEMQGRESLELAVAHLAPGLYLLRLLGVERQETRLIIIDH